MNRREFIAAAGAMQVDALLRKLSPSARLLQRGADGGSRTHTPNREEDFKSPASTVPPRPLREPDDGRSAEPIPL
jgi:hypothetical protein